jgi:hypothetical protein
MSALPQVIKPLSDTLKISIMSGKLKGFKALNTNTLSNDFCVKMYNSGNKEIICTFCYSHNMLNTYRKSCIDPWQNNSDILSKSLLKEYQLPRIKESEFRFHGHGELINSKHLKNFVLIAKHNSHCNFALWTKRKDIVRAVFKNQPVPFNLILVYSNPKIDSVIKSPPKWFDKVFNNVSKPHSDENCTGQKCKDCLACYEFNDTNVIIERVK